MSQSKRGSSGLSKVLVYLSPKEVRRLPKPRAGFEKYARQLVALATEHSDVLRIKGFDAEATLAELRACTEMNSVVRDARLQLAMALETRLMHAANAWRTTLRIYQHARVAAPDDVRIESGIASFAKFMKTGRRKKRKAPKR